ncbi:methyltransferase domain-containing protein [Streptomyces sp. NPDC046887]|uniref:SAM-dependent methyltransferase n=1 Tax=Streptomyces sp. NPDC046887 TaxID=3155472 RepID=UPI003411CA40
MSTDSTLAHTYGHDTNPLFRVLLPLGWGHLHNLGYYTPATLPALLTGLAPFQRALARRSIDLLRLKPGQHVLDAACGTGHTTRLIADQGCTVTGIDLFPGHLDEAARRHGHHAGIRFARADATDLRRAGPDTHTPRLQVDDAAYDKVHCLEAAFHFGPRGRRAFLEEAYRVLRPGGRLVLVDFVWNSDDPGEIRAADPGRLVRDTWGFEEFEPLHRYVRHAIDIGYAPCRVHDWTRPVTARFMRIGHLCARLALTGRGRRLLCRRWPMLRELTTADWLAFSATALAHEPVRRASGYAALVLDKPPAQGGSS